MAKLDQKSDVIDENNPLMVEGYQFLSSIQSHLASKMFYYGRLDKDGSDDSGHKEVINCIENTTNIQLKSPNTLKSKFGLQNLEIIEDKGKPENKHIEKGPIQNCLEHDELDQNRKLKSLETPNFSTNVTSWTLGAIQKSKIKAEKTPNRPKKSVPKMASNCENIDKYLIRSTKVPSQDVDVLKNSRNEPCPILANTPKLDLIKTDLDADIENKTEFKTEIMARDKPSFEAKQSQEISGIEIISTIGDISHEFDAKYPNISNISRNNAVNNPTILSSNPSIQLLNPPTVSKKYERFSDIISSDLGPPKS